MDRHRQRHNRFIDSIEASSSSSSSSSSSATAAAAALCANNAKKIQVLYFLSRGGHLEHPHLLELPSSSEPLYLRDVLQKLTVIRGKGMPSLFSWSYKRRFKGGFVWQDISEADPIFPAYGTEYVLMGSQVLPYTAMIADDNRINGEKGQVACIPSNSAKSEPISPAPVNSLHFLSTRTKLQQIIDKQVEEEEQEEQEEEEGCTNYDALSIGQMRIKSKQMIKRRIKAEGSISSLNSTASNSPTHYSSSSIHTAESSPFSVHMMPTLKSASSTANEKLSALPSVFSHGVSVSGTRKDSNDAVSSAAIISKPKNNYWASCPSSSSGIFQILTCGIVDIKEEIVPLSLHLRTKASER